jgi:hyperosmotically inducible protein
MNSNNKIFSPGMVLIIVLAIGGCDKMDKKEAVHEELALSAETTVGTEIDDSVITTKVKSALMTDPDIKIFDIKVETRKGEVQLSGFVNNATQSERAIVVVQGVDGVRKVIDKMALKVIDTTVGVKIDDAAITTKVKSGLLAAAELNSTDVGVVTRDGIVQLSGFVNSQTQIDRVIEVTQGIGGVQGIFNEMIIKK